MARFVLTSPKIKLPSGTKSPFGALPQEGFLTRWIQNIFWPKASTAPTAKSPASGKSLIPKVSAGTKATIGTVAASSAIFAATGGPAITESASQFGIAGLQSVNDINRFFSSNPLLLLALIGLGVLLVVKK